MAAFAVIAAFASAAQAASVRYDAAQKRIFYVAGAGEFNDLTVIVLRRPVRLH